MKRSGLFFDFYRKEQGLFSNVLTKFRFVDEFTLLKRLLTDVVIARIVIEKEDVLAFIDSCICSFSVANTNRVTDILSVDLIFRLTTTAENCLEILLN